MTKSKMKVLAIVNAVFGYDGISTVATNYYRYQDKELVDMDLLTINPVNENLKKEFEDNGNHVYTLEGRNRNPLSYMMRLKKIIAQNRYDIVHVHGNSATMAIELLAASLAGCKIRIAHSHNTQCNHKVFNKLLMPVFSCVLTHCCACSPEAGRFLFGDRECYVVNNGLYFSKYRFNPSVRERIRAQYGLQKKFVIGHIGRFALQKNHAFLLKVFSEVVKKEPESVLLLVGEGELMPEMRQLSEQLGVADRVMFYGTTDCTNEIVQAMDCFVFPSLFEGLGIVAVEAQAAGVSCVNSTEVPLKAKVLDETVFLSLEESVERWAEEVIAHRASEEHRISSVNAVQEKLIEAKFDIVRNCQNMYEHYCKILEGVNRD